MKTYIFRETGEVRKVRHGEYYIHPSCIEFGQLEILRWNLANPSNASYIIMKLSEELEQQVPVNGFDEWNW